MRSSWMVLSLAVIAGATQAQDRPERRDRDIGGRGFFLIGWQRSDLADLNRAMVAAALPDLGESGLSLGGGGFASRGRWLVGGEGHAVIERSKATPSGALRTQVVGGFGLAELGYLVYRGRQVDAYPMVGIGGGAVGLSIFERSTPTFGEVLTDPGRASHLTSGSLLVNLGFGADYRLPLRRGRHGGFLLGIRAGWILGLWPSDWQLENRFDVSGGPDATLGGPYVRLAIGGWGTRGASREKER